MQAISAAAFGIANADTAAGIGNDIAAVFVGEIASARHTATPL